MQLEIQKADERGEGQASWLKSRFSFSFAEYHNPKRMGFGALRVINDDEVVGDGGFGMHGHRDMEIVTIVLSGELVHEDSLGNKKPIRSGEAQRMSAGSGIQHAEFNGSTDKPLKLLQIWIQTKEKGIAPSYEYASFDALGKNCFEVVASGFDEVRQLYIHQEARILRGSFGEESSFFYEIDDDECRGAYIFVIEGELSVGGHLLSRRDAAEISECGSFELHISPNSDILLFDLPLCNFRH